jgi:hypothetical protein
MNSLALLPARNVTGFEMQFIFLNITAKELKIPPLTKFTSSLNIWSQFVSSVMTSLRKVVC